MKLIKNVLNNVPAYVALQKVVGADRLRYRCIAELDIQQGNSVLDVGCGPAYYFQRLPGNVRYHGFDTDAGYIEWAREKWGSERATFHHGIFDEAAAAALPSFDAVLLLGLLHHLSDDDSRSLLRLCAKKLAPGGWVVSVDTCYEPGQGMVSRWMSNNDRGEYVREPAAFLELAGDIFGKINGDILSDVTRIPASYWSMRMNAPLNPGDPTVSTHAS
ncbi:MAG: class I SAM-dependent methyltransferase [Nocardioidaceae bacterium]|nr:class I SAM-dependent methyltransferase [Nocardioidaceae bacterium]